jgi:hypothetical protein
MVNMILAERWVAVGEAYQGRALYPGSDVPDHELANRLPHVASPKLILDDLAGGWISTERIVE